MNKETMKAWFQASRPPFFIATFIPLSIGWVLAGADGSWHPWRFFIVALGAFFIHLVTNLANDYFDHLQGTDDGLSIGGSRVLQEGKISLPALKRAIILCYFAAFLIASYLIVSLKIWLMAPFILFSLLSSYFYVAPPIRYGYHGLGEVFVAINMGPIMVVGTYWVMTGVPGWLPFYISLPIGLMVASILYYQNIPDIDTDRNVGKNTLAVRLGYKNAIRGLIVLFIAIYGSIVLLILTKQLPREATTCFLSIPIFWMLLNNLKQTNDPVIIDGYGKYVRILYFFNGMVILLSLLYTKIWF
jgi:1,4-dihydroxy-2-naphthoate octaprenyltransferase